MKKILPLLLICYATLFIAGCDFGKSPNNFLGNQTDIIAQGTPDEIISTFTKAINENSSQIKQEDIRWISKKNNEGFYISGYSISKSGVKNGEIPNIDTFFNGWIRNFIGDEIGGSMVEYQKNDVVCYYYSFFEQEIPEEFYTWDIEYGDSEEFNKKWEDFYNNVTYEITLDCGNIPEDEIKIEDMYFDSIGQEPYWYASIRGYSINRTDPNGLYDFYINSIAKSGDNYIINGYDIQGTISKEKCTDNGKGAIHEYKTTFTIKGDSKFEGCADKTHFNININEQGSLKFFNEKMNFNLKGGDNTFYEVHDITKNYALIYIYDYTTQNDNSYYLILDKKGNGRKILYQGNYDISDDECEELNQYDNELMDMFFLIDCPRG